ncbi:hypothetical protein PV11_04664 [Exophiala sideris]|uniref:Uncharacterized protein n=1 Tax=Exophiala sideris TaxID=1016849 RepID=A0A0D1YI84_9EURO|nr:hypothetical protein PV11_04664 [Exophiala sideris]
MDEHLRAVLWREAFDDSRDTDRVETVDQHIISAGTNGQNSDDDLQVVKTSRKRSWSPNSDESDIPPRGSRVRASLARSIVPRTLSSPSMRRASQQSTRTSPDDQDGQTARRILQRSPQRRDGPFAKQSEDIALARALKASQESYAAEKNVAQEKARGFVSAIADDRREEEELQWVLRISKLEYKAQQGDRRQAEEPERRPTRTATTGPAKIRAMVIRPFAPETSIEPDQRSASDSRRAITPKQSARLLEPSTTEGEVLRSHVEESLRYLRTAAEQVQLKTLDIGPSTEDDHVRTNVAQYVTEGSFETDLTDFCRKYAGDIEPIRRTSALGGNTRSTRALTERLPTPPPSQGSPHDATENDTQPLVDQNHRLRAENTRLRRQNASLGGEMEAFSKREAKLKRRVEELVEELKEYEGLLFRRRD